MQVINGSRYIPKTLLQQQKLHNGTCIFVKEVRVEWLVVEPVVVELVHVLRLVVPGVAQPVRGFIQLRIAGFIEFGRFVEICRSIKFRGQIRSVHRCPLKIC